MLCCIIGLTLMIPGLALFYGGLVRKKNVLSVLAQCLGLTGMVTILWWAVGYTIVFGEGGSPFFGSMKHLFMKGVTSAPDTNYCYWVSENVFAMFQMTFAIITPALVVGGFAERMKFSAMLLFSGLWLALVYVPVCHWVWGSGWLAGLGLMDYAGGTVVHVNAGVAALVAALVLGRRRGFPDTLILPHNLTMTVTGAGMLWVGWFGFNAGSALAADGNAGMAMLVTHTGAAAGALTWMTIEWLRHGKPSVLGIVTGMVAGLGTITPASGYVGPLAALAIGVVAGGVCFVATQYIKRTLRIDDSLDVFPVHGVGGVIGTLSVGVFAAVELGGTGFSAGSMGRQLGVQAIGVLATIAWSGGLSYVLLKLIDAAIGLRVDAESETTGLDISLHEERGYDL